MKRLGYNQPSGLCRNGKSLWTSAWLMAIGLLPLQILNAAEGVGSAAPLVTPSPRSLETPALKIPNPLSSDPQTLSQQSRIRVNRILVEGNRVFSDEALASITARYIDRMLSAEDLRQLRHELTLYYVDHGYINSGAVLPEQNVSDGNLRIRIVEGRLTSVELEGLEHLQARYLISRIEKHTTDEALNLRTLQNDLQLIQQNPLLKRINAELTPGLRPGEAILRAASKKPIPGI